MSRVIGHGEGGHGEGLASRRRCGHRVIVRKVYVLCVFFSAEIQRSSKRVGGFSCAGVALRMGTGSIDATRLQLVSTPCNPTHHAYPAVSVGVSEGSFP